jgi:hypothetical protein
MGALLLFFLYFDLDIGVYALLLVMFFEGISSILLPDIVNHVLYRARNSSIDENLAPIQKAFRFSFSAERAWRLVVGLMLFISYILFNQNYQLLPQSLIDNFSYINWFIPWFMGFAIFGAGVSAICPVLIAVKWVGFK